jgi:hypothetical protein
MVTRSIKMRAAYDAVVWRLQIKVDDPRTAQVAASIAGFADEGIRDVQELEQLALATFERKRKRG